MLKKIIALFLIISLILITIIFLYDIKIYSIKGRSMQPSLPAGSMVLVSSLYYKFFTMQIGDLALIRTVSGDLALKRCFLKAGDAINYNSHYLRNSSGSKILLDNLSEDLQNKSIVPQDYYYFVGDNLSSSLDSRIYGLVAKDQVVGKVLAWRV